MTEAPAPGRDAPRGGGAGRIVRGALVALPVALVAAFWAPLADRTALRDPPDAWLLAPARALGLGDVGWMLETTRGGVRRPLAWLTFAVGDGSARAQYLQQVGWTAACAGLLALLTYVLLRVNGAARLWRWGVPLTAALVGTAWGVHPLRAEGAATLAARGDVVATAFGLLAAACLAVAVAGPRMRRGVLAVAGIASLAAALASPVSAAFVVGYAGLARWIARARPDSRAATAPVTWPLTLLSLPPVLALLAAAAVRPAGAPVPLAASAASLGHGLLAPLWETLRPVDLHPFRDAPPAWPGEVPASWWVQAAAALLLVGAAVRGAVRGRGYGLAATTAFAAAALAWWLERSPAGSDVAATAATVPLYLAVGLAIGDGAGCCLAFLGLPLVAGGVLAPAWSSLDLRRAWRDDASVAERVLTLDPTNDRVHAALGDAARSRGATAEAEAHYRRALDVRGVRPWSEAGMGGLALDRADLAEATLRLERAAAAAPWLPGTWIDLGAARLQLGRPDDAVRALDTAVRLDPENAPAWFTLGRARIAKGDRFTAAEAFRRAVALDPEDVRAREELERLEHP